MLEDHLPVMVRETERLQKIIEDLLALSRLDQGRTEIELKSVDLTKLVCTFSEDRAALAEEKGITLKCKHLRDLPIIQADEAMIEQVLAILLTNAINYTPNNGKITVETGLEDHEGERCAVFRVSDTGYGMSPEEQSRLFERFFRGKASRESKASGTGLGLAIAQEIVSRHNGRIEVESEVDKGSTFSIWLPITQ